MAKLDFIHVGISVKDFDVTKSFYEKLGFKLSKEPFDTTWDGYWSNKNFFYKLPEGTNGRIFFMESENGVKLEFFEFSTMENAGKAIWNHVGIHHIALTTDDINAVADSLRAAGIKFELGPIKGTTQNFMFLCDPDGNFIEIGQPYN